MQKPEWVFCTIFAQTLTALKRKKMTIHPLWNDNYWLLLMQLYMRKPVGVKALYSRQMIALSLDLHIPPQILYRQMFALRRRETPTVKRLWMLYHDNPRRLKKAVRTVYDMRDLCSGGLFYKDVEVKETFELDYKPIAGCADLKPVTLIMALDLYFRLTPATMTTETPEVRELARTVKVSPQRVTDILAHYILCDPYLNVGLTVSDTPLLEACRNVWKRYGNGNPEVLSSLAAQLREYF